MNESKRVFLNKKIIFSFLILITICFSFFLYTQYQNTYSNGCSVETLNSYRKEFFNDLSNKTILQARNIVSEQLDYVSTVNSLINFERMKLEDKDNYLDVWQDKEEELRDLYPEISKEYDENKNLYSENDYSAKEAVLLEILTQIEYIIDYPDYLDSIDSKSEQMNEISIFSNADSLSNSNIKKTADDYANLKHIDLELGNDKPIISVVNFGLVHYIIFIFNLAIIIVFIQERKSGLWNIIHATKKGRFSLAIKRIGILTVSVFLSTAIAYTILFITSFLLYGGIGDVFRSVQSIQEFQNFVFPMSVLGFIAFYVFISALSQFVLILFVWLIISLIRTINIALGFAGVILAVEFTLYKLLPIQSNLSILKCVNLFCFVDPTTEVAKYHNLNFLNIVINRFWLIFYSLIAFILIFGLITVLVSAFKYPESNGNKLTNLLNKFFKKLADLYWQTVEKISIIGYELYKLLIIQKGWIVLTVLIFVLFNTVNTTEIYQSETESIVNEFYEKYSGQLTDFARQYAVNLKDEIEKVDSELAQAYLDYREGKITQNNYNSHVLKSDAFDSKREALNIIQERINYAEKQGDNAWLVNPEGYIELLDSKAFSRQQNFALLSVFCIIIILSNVFAYEKQSMVYPVLMSSFKGRQFLFRKKVLAATIITLIIWLCTSCVEVISVCIRSPIENLNAPIYSIEFLNIIPFNCSLIIFLLGLYISKLLIMISVCFIVCLISTLGKYEISMIISTILLVVPALLYILGIDFWGYISVIPPLASMKLILSSNGTTYFIQLVLMLILGISSIFFARQKWCKERRFGNDT